MRKQLAKEKAVKAVWIKGYISNPKDAKLKVEVEFCVDTGASCCVIPKKLAKQIGLEIVGKAQVQLADGTITTFPLAYVCIVICEKPVFALASIVESATSPLLGFDVMELLEVQIDVRNRKLLKPIKLFKIRKFFLNILPGSKHEVLLI